MPGNADFGLFDRQLFAKSRGQSCSCSPEQFIHLCGNRISKLSNLSARSREARLQA